MSKNEEIGLDAEYRQSYFINQPHNGDEISRRSMDKTLIVPFEIQLKMPPTDRGMRGYSDGYIRKITKKLYPDY